MVDSQIGPRAECDQFEQILSNHTLLIVTTDHGGGGIDAANLVARTITSTARYKDYTIPFFLGVPGIPAGADLYGLFRQSRRSGTNRVDYTWFRSRCAQAIRAILL